MIANNIKKRYSVKRSFKPKTPVEGKHVCIECKISFNSFHTYNKPIYCSEVCRNIRTTRMRKVVHARYRAKRYTPPQPRECQYCGELFTPRGTRSDAKFCGLKCGNRGRSIKRIYGIEVSDYHNMYKQQKGLCAACYSPIDGVAYIDHNHKTGAIRGLLHGNCNTVLGFVKDNPDILENLAKYLRRQ
jgi:hypothetical protein